MHRKWKNWCQNEVSEETKGANSRDKVKRKTIISRAWHKMWAIASDGVMWSVYLCVCWSRS